MGTEGIPVQDEDAIPTLQERWDRIWAAITNPLNVSPLSPEGKIGLLDLWWAVKMFFIGFAKRDPGQAGECFFYTVVAIFAIMVLHLIGWIF